MPEFSTLPTRIRVSSSVKQGSDKIFSLVLLKIKILKYKNNTLILLF